MADTETAGNDELRGLRVFLAEDESLIMMLLEDILADLDCQVVASALSLRQGLEAAEAAEADVAILDINLGGDPVFPLAERLDARGVPVIFASGYGATTLPDAWKTRPTLPKPFTATQVRAALEAARGIGLP